MTLMTMEIQNSNFRNIEFSAPYMHDGRFFTLEEVIKSL